MPTIGRKKYRQLNMAKEGTNGSLQTPFLAPWRGPVDGAVDMRVLTEQEENVGIIGETNRSYMGKSSGEVTIPSVPCTFEQVQLLLIPSFQGPVTGVAGTDSANGETSKIYTTTIPTTFAASPLTTLNSYSIQVGDDFEHETLTYCMCSHIEWSFSQGEAVKVTAKFIGRPPVYQSSGLTAPTIPAVEDIIASKGILYLDAINGTYGTTQVSNSVISGKITADIKFEPYYPSASPMTTDISGTYGVPMPQTYVYTSHKISGELTFLHDTPVTGTGTGQKVNWRKQTALKMALDFIGAPLVQTISSGSPQYTNKHLRFNLPIKYSKISALADKSGADVYAFSFTSRYNLTSGDAGSIVVVLDNVATIAV